jgi:hypothetical protein
MSRTSYLSVMWLITLHQNTYLFSASNASQLRLRWSNLSWWLELLVWTSSKAIWAMFLLRTGTTSLRIGRRTPQWHIIPIASGFQRASRTSLNSFKLWLSLKAMNTTLEAPGLIFGVYFSIRRVLPRISHLQATAGKRLHLTLSARWVRWNQTKHLTVGTANVKGVSPIVQSVVLPFRLRRRTGYVMINQWQTEF